MKVCARKNCGRRFYPRSNRQRFCTPECRYASSAVPHLRPELKPRRCELCGSWFRPTAAHQKYCSPAHRYRARVRVESDLYDANHRTLRKRWKPVVATGTVVCGGPNGCQRLILPHEAWDLGHLRGIPGEYAGPQHARCNRATRRKRRAG